jgi:hypothetical protein
MTVLPGCGGGDDSKDKSDSGTKSKEVLVQPRVRQPITTQVLPFSRAVATQSCEAYEPLLFSFIRQRQPGSATKPGDCRDGDEGLGVLRGARVDRSVRIGTGALMEGPAGRGRRWTIWVLDADGVFRYSGVSGSTPQVGTSLGKRTEAESVADRFIRAVRSRDCPAMQRLFSPRGSRLAVSLGSTRAACRAVLRGRFFAPAVRELPAVHPQVLGGTKDVAFVGVPTRQAYFTLVLGDLATHDLRVLDVLPNTAVDLPSR